MSKAMTVIGDTSFDALYRAHYGSMVRLATLLVDRQELAEELVQDAFARLYQHWSKVVSPLPYLRTCVVHASQDALRRRRLARRHQGRLVPGVVDPTEHLRDAIVALPARQRAVIVLRFYEDLTIDEIADSLKCRPGTVKSSLHRALSHLRKAIEP